MRMTLYRSNSRGNAKNCSYPVKCVVDNEEDCLAATAFDHVCGKFKGSYRSVDNFEEADCSVADCDNSHSDNPKDWVYPEDMAEKLPEVSYAILPSRSNMKPKGGKSARPRFHMYFPHDPVTDADAYAALKKAIQQKFPFFDGNALDAARFIFGNATGRSSGMRGRSPLTVS